MSDIDVEERVDEKQEEGQKKEGPKKRGRPLGSKVRFICFRPTAARKSTKCGQSLKRGVYVNRLRTSPRREMFQRRCRKERRESEAGLSAARQV
jgi:hypothetical protein